MRSSPEAVLAADRRWPDSPDVPASRRSFRLPRDGRARPSQAIGRGKLIIEIDRAETGASPFAAEAAPPLLCFKTKGFRYLHALTGKLQLPADAHAVGQTVVAKQRAFRGRFRFIHPNTLQRRIDAETLTEGCAGGAEMP